MLNILKEQALQICIVFLIPNAYLRCNLLRLLFIKVRLENVGSWTYTSAIIFMFVMVVFLKRFYLFIFSQR